MTPIRTCVACRRRRSKPDLVRLVAVAGALTVDSQAKLPGRGAYVCRDPGCLAAALRTDGGRLRRALRQQVSVDEAALQRQAVGAPAPPANVNKKVSA